MVAIVKHDLDFILRQIKIAEAHLEGRPLTEIRIDANGNVTTDPTARLAVPTTLSPYGLRTVDGSYNNLMAGRDQWGAADNPFSRLTDPVYRNESDDSITFGPGAVLTDGNYGQMGLPSAAARGLDGGTVVDADPRIISNLIVDQTLDNPAAIYAALAHGGVSGADLTTALAAIRTAKVALDAAKAGTGPTSTEIAALQEDLADATAAATLAEEVAATARATADEDEAARAVAHADVVLAETAVSDADAALSALETDAVPDADQTEELDVANGLLSDAQSALTAALEVEAPFKAAAETSAAAASAADAAAATASDLVADAAAALAAAVTATGNATAAVAAAQAALDAVLGTHGIVMNGESLVIPNVAPDEGLSAPYNSWFTLFGQFFDHGLDLVQKGGNGTIYIPLQEDDPLYNPASPSTNFMVLTRTTPDTVNLTTPWVDQNQTYTSHSSHQLFLREYALVDGKPVSTGKLLQGDRGLATWADVKDQARTMLGIDLTDADVANIPLFVMDEYGEFVRGPNGFPQIVRSLGLDGKFGGGDDVFAEGNREAPISTAGAVRTGHAFLDDIAHAAVPGTSFDHDNNPATATIAVQADNDTVAGNPVSTDSRGNKIAYDNELLDAHYITGDGRGNENIGLSAVHHIFHSEHNHMVDQVKDLAIASGDLAFLNEWLRVDVETMPRVRPTSLR